MSTVNALPGPIRIPANELARVLGSSPAPGNDSGAPRTGFPASRGAGAQRGGSMSAGGRSYTDAEILARSDMTWWEYAAEEGLPTSVSRRASQRIERGPYSYVARRKPTRDYLSEPLDYLALPLDVLKGGADVSTH